MGHGVYAGGRMTADSNPNRAVEAVLPEDLELTPQPVEAPPPEVVQEDRSAFAFLRVFRHRNYRLFFTGQLVSLMGTWITGYWNTNKFTDADYDFFEFPTVKDGVPRAAVGPVDGLVIAANAKNMEGAEKLLAFMISKPDVQAKWASIQGALSANEKVDPKTYTPVMQHALDVAEDLR